MLIPSNITKIDEWSFFGCSKLKTIDFEKDSELKTIEKFAFYKSSIETITIPRSLNELKDKWCVNTPHLKNIIFMPNNEIYDYYNDAFIIKRSSIDKNVKDTLIFARRDIKIAIIPSFIKKIGNYAFENCSNLQKIIFSNKSQLKEFDECAFSKSSLKNILIPKSVSYIGSSAFGFCSKLCNIVIPHNSKLKFIDENAFDNASIKNISIPSNVSIIGRYAFNECKNLEYVSFPENSDLSVIQNNAFCFSSIKCFSIPKKVSTLGKNIFTGCKNLKIIEFPCNIDLLAIIDEYQYEKSFQPILMIPAKLIKS